MFHRITLACFLGLFALQAEATTFKIATISPDGTRWMQELRQGAAEIKERTEGRVKFRFYPGGVMGNDKSVLRKIRIGQLHGGAITGGGLQVIDPDSQLYNLPLAFRSLDEVDYVRKHMDTLILDSLYQRGFVSFGLSEAGFAYLMSNQPVDKAEDLKGLRVWSPEGDDLSRASFEAVDIMPIPLPLTDVLTGLQTGLIDTVAISAIGAIGLQWHTTVKYMTDIPLIYLYGTLLIQRKAFEKISTADQAVVREVMSAILLKLNRLNRHENEQARETLKRQGITFITPTEEDRRRWFKRVDAAKDRIYQEGRLSPAITDTFNRHINDFRHDAGQHN